MLEKHYKLSPIIILIMFLFSGSKTSPDMFSQIALQYRHLAPMLEKHCKLSPVLKVIMFFFTGSEISVLPTRAASESRWEYESAPVSRGGRSHSPASGVRLHTPGSGDPPQCRAERHHWGGQTQLGLGAQEGTAVMALQEGQLFT